MLHTLTIMGESPHPQGRDPHPHSRESHQAERSWGSNLREGHNPGSQRMLFDPKNPNKPILIPGSSGPQGGGGPPRGGDNTLHFKETDQQSPQSPQTHAPFPAGFPPMGFRPPGYPPMYPGFDPRFSPDAPYGPMPPVPPYFYGYPPQYREAALHMNEAFSREYQGWVWIFLAPWSGHILCCLQSRAPLRDHFFMSPYT